VVNGWTNWANITCADGECTAWSALCSSGSLIDGVHREPNRIRAHCRAAAGSTTGAVWKNDGASCPAGQLGTGLRCDTKYCDHPKTRCSVPVGLSVDPTSTNVTVADFSSIIFPASHYLRRTNCGTTQCEWTYSRAQLVPTP
jgi:hypothetical protein